MDVVANTEPDWYEKVFVLTPELGLESLLMLLLLMTSLLCSLLGTVADTDTDEEIDVDDVDVAFGGIALYCTVPGTALF